MHIHGLRPDELQHHGVLGMKWGVRRYQNYDGSYTKKGLARYKKAEEEYEAVKAKQKEGTADRKNVKAAKRKLSNAYDQLKRDNAADEGRNLYTDGKTILENNIAANKKIKGISLAYTLGYPVAMAVLGEYADTEVTNIARATITAGAAAAAIAVKASTNEENKKLRAYYGHKSNGD
jgi:hypothetical protein